MAIYAKIKGQKQGDIKGAVAEKGHEGQIQVLQITFGVGSPYDHATGLATGKRVPRPIVLTKPMDKSSPLLYAACTTNEVLTTCTIYYTKEGAEHKNLATIELTNAMVKDYNHEGSGKGDPIERITLTYTKFELTWVEGGIVASDDWTTSA